MLLLLRSIYHNPELTPYKSPKTQYINKIDSVVCTYTIQRTSLHIQVGAWMCNTVTVAHKVWVDKG